MNLPSLPSLPPPGNVKDVVCGMNVDPARTKHSAVHEDKKYFFCSAGCLEKFRRDPAKYLSGGAHEAMESAAPAAPDPPLAAGGSGAAGAADSIASWAPPEKSFAGSRRNFSRHPALQKQYFLSS